MEDDILIGMEIIHKHGVFLVSVLHCGWFFGGDIVEGGFDAGGNFIVIEDGAGYFLDKTSFFICQGSGRCEQWFFVEMSCSHRMVHSIGKVNYGVRWEVRAQIS